MTNRIPGLVAVVFSAAIAFGLAGKAHASGFGIREGSADWLANAFAGETAKAYDASTAYANPAGMALLDRSEIDGDISLIAPEATFTGSNANPLTGTPVSGTTGGNAISPAASGGLFGVWILSPDLRLGFGVTAPYGERVSYPFDFVGRYQSVVSSITDINLGLALSYRVDDRLSIGGGPTIDYFNARLTQALNIPRLSALVGDPIADVHGDDVGVGFNLGLLYRLTPSTRVGLDYRSRVEHDIDGTQSVSFPSLYAVLSPPTAAFLAAQNSSAKTTVTLPDSVSIGLYHDIDPNWAVMSDLEWTHWSLFRTLTIIPTGAFAQPTVIAENWRNTVFAGVGANYRASDDLTLQAGFSYDQSPVTDANRTSRVPDNDHFVLGFGVTYAVSPTLKLQLAYAHLFVPDGAVATSASPASGTLTGTYADADDSVTIGVNVRF